MVLATNWARWRFFIRPLGRERKELSVLIFFGYIIHFTFSETMDLALSEIVSLRWSLRLARSRAKNEWKRRARKRQNESRDLQDSLQIDLYVSRNMTHRAGRAPGHFFPFSHCEPSNFLRQCSLGLQMPEFFSDIRHVGLCGRKGVYWGIGWSGRNWSNQIHRKMAEKKTCQKDPTTMARFYAHRTRPGLRACQTRSSTIIIASNQERYERPTITEAGIMCIMCVR